MVQINFILFNGEKISVDAKPGESLMRIATTNSVEGIDADCGGACSCATCHVFVDEAWLDKVDHPKQDEEALLSLNPDRKTNSRLSCQIDISDNLDGLIVHLPEFQF